MSRVEELSRRYNIPLTDTRVSGDVVAKQLAGHRVVVHPKTISRLRLDRTSGAKIGTRLELGERLDAGVERKDRFYLELCEAGKEIRRGGAGRKKGYANNTFLSELGDYTGIDPQDVRRSFRAMRADLVMSERAGETGNMGVFRSTIEEYLNQYTGYSPSISLGEVSNGWDYRTAESFYRNFYGHVSRSNTLRTLPPYEIDFLSDFYESRIQDGSLPSPLDNITIAKKLGMLPLGEVVETIRSETGVKYDGVVFFAHSNVIETGFPTRFSGR